MTQAERNLLMWLALHIELSLDPYTHIPPQNTRMHDLRDALRALYDEDQARKGEASCT